MNDYLRAIYGDPCRGCGYDWSHDPVTCDGIVVGAPARFEAVLAGRGKREPCGELQWNATAYVTHLADVVRIWSDRVAAAALGSSDPVVPFDEDALGTACGYLDLPLTGGLWALGRAVGDWKAAETLADPMRTTLNHPEQGVLSLDEVRRILAHEAEHHFADLMVIVTT